MLVMVLNLQLPTTLKFSTQKKAVLLRLVQMDLLDDKLNEQLDFPGTEKQKYTYCA